MACKSLSKTPALRRIKATLIYRKTGNLRAVQSRKLFVAERNVSIFMRIAKLVGREKDIVGGALEGAIPAEIFAEMFKKFPNSIELDRYANARVANIVGEYLDPQ
jgi:hypothetical protein